MLCCAVRVHTFFFNNFFCVRFGFVMYMCMYVYMIVFVCMRLGLLGCVCVCVGVTSSCACPSCVLFPVHVVETRAMATAVVVAVRGGKVDVDVNVNFAALVLCVVCSLLYFCWKSTVVSKGEEGELSLM